MILESIVTTIGVDGRINLAPMGPVVSQPDAMTSSGSADPGFILRPFEGSRTFENLRSTRRATIHVTDDAALFARAAVSQLDDQAVSVRRSDCGQWATLNHCHRWFAVEVISVAETPPRHEMVCRVVNSGITAPFFGFNRAKHAVIEAAILATRTHLISAEDVRSQLDALKPLVDKTAGDAERDAFETLASVITQRIKPHAPTGTP
ncbi:DUF447 family protein [Stieleria sp. ICT_E10.1]|uniref:DUF447 domain-containing protein n=1 Tax=Stieleria sedimenti TaxID=2976331 RepID=UPI0021805522|nr:DUF447 domain-containing protein [Stieleria sedimenti]MCS7467086.1 DUF447 family protein [Stieleria sedimenti]